MGLKSWLAPMLADLRIRQIRKRYARPVEAQRALLAHLLKTAAHTSFGREHRFDLIHDPETYRKGVPVRDYEGHRPWIDRLLRGEKNVLWPDQPIYFAKTSGTTSGAKYIPITKASMPLHIQGARDALAFYIHHTRKSQFLDGNMMFLSGSPVLETHTASGIPIGRLSGIAHHYVPGYLLRNRLPSFKVNCIEDWNEKLDRIVEETYQADLRLISGIPPWVQMLFERIIHHTGRTPAELWPRLQVFFQGGVDYTPYAELFEQTLGKQVDVLEVYPASEGFIGVQDEVPSQGLMLMLDYGIYYEFIPLEAYGTPDPPRLGLAEVELGQQYAIILTTNAGLWAYDIGDSIRFTSLNPHRIRVTGRVKHFISTFGEHVIEEEVNEAMRRAVRESGASILEFTVAPHVAEKGSSWHEWLIEFEHFPEDWTQFLTQLDHSLREQNPYYNDLRNAQVLQQPQVHPLRPHACRDYMQSLGKLGGQNKFPRLSNDRRIADALYTDILPPQTSQ